MAAAASRNGAVVPRAASVPGKGDNMPSFLSAGDPAEATVQQLASKAATAEVTALASHLTKVRPLAAQATIGPCSGAHSLSVLVVTRQLVSMHFCPCNAFLRRPSTRGLRFSLYSCFSGVSLRSQIYLRRGCIREGTFLTCFPSCLGGKRSPGIGGLCKGC